RVILDSELRIPHGARVLDDAASTVIFTSHEADPASADQLRSRGIRVEAVGKDNSGLSIPEVLARLSELGIDSLLVEGGSSVITRPAGLVTATETVADLGPPRITDEIHLSNGSLVTVEDDLILAWAVDYAATA